MHQQCIPYTMYQAPPQKWTRLRLCNVISEKGGPRGKVIAHDHTRGHTGSVSRAVILLCCGAADKSAGESCLDIQVLPVTITM